MTAYVRTGLRLQKRRRVLVAAEDRLRKAIRGAAVMARDVERVRQGQLSFIKALTYELQSGTEVDDASRPRLASAAEADAAWQAATADQIVAVYSRGDPITPGHVPRSFFARS